MVIADVMDFIDSSIANLAGPSIRADLGGSDSTLQWVLSAYTATFALGLVTSGRLGDILGRRRLFLVGMVGFTVASLACGLAPDMPLLIVSRALQGLAGAVMMFAGAIAAFGLFVASERRSDHPVITPSLFGRRSFVVGLLVVAGFYASQTGFTVAFNLLLQLGFQWTALHTGLTLIPWALGTAVGTVLSGGVLARRLGRRTLRLGLGLAVVGMLALAATIAANATDLNSYVVAPALLVGGFGAGMVFIPLFDYILGDATAEEVGIGSGMLNAVQQFASALGAAALGTVFFTRAAGGSRPAHVSATELIVIVAAVAFVLTFLRVGLLPKQIQQGDPIVEDVMPAEVVREAADRSG